MLLPLISPPGVYRPQSDTEALGRAIDRSDLAGDADVLDLGTGTGAAALAAARAGARSVTAVDLSRRAVLAARLNARRRRAPVTVVRGDLFAPVRGHRFDLVVSNPPYVPARTDRLPRYRMARCWDGGRDGRVLIDRICAGAADHLRPGGSLLLVHSGVCDVGRTLDVLAAHGLAGRVVERVRIPFGPVMRARLALHETRGLSEPHAVDEELVVVEASRAR